MDVSSTATPCDTGATFRSGLECGDRTPLNTLILFIALHGWPAPAWVPPGRAVAAVTRLFAAISIFALEMQVATWLSIATIRSVVALNVAVALVSAAVYVARTLRVREASLQGSPHKPPRQSAAYILGICVLAAGVLVLNAMRPVLAADPYHLDRMAQIERLGTIGYDPAAEPKVNSFGWTYELVLADLVQIPYAGPVLLRFHGLLGLSTYLLAILAAGTWLPPSRGWYLTALLVVPVVFHQLVLIKNDLFGAVPAIVVLTWLVMRSAVATPKEIGWAAWLCGFAIAVKVTSAPMALVLAGTLLIQRADRGAVARAGVIGGLVGLMCGGFFFTLVENFRMYGSPVTAFKESGAMGNRNETASQAAISIVRFLVSLFDLGQITRVVWPGRGGWGATFGLPFIWALAVLISYRRRLEVRRALWIAAIYMLVFAAMYTDADIAHRLILGPGLLLILVAVSILEDDDRRAGVLQTSLYAVIVLSVLQIARSATLYLRS